MPQRLLWFLNSVVMLITAFLIFAHFAHPPLNAPANPTLPGPAAP